MNCIFLWENFGPMHVDRCNAVAKSGLKTLGLELYGTSNTYDWIPEQGDLFQKITLFKNNKPTGFKLIKALLSFRLKTGKAAWFLCHYERKEIFIFACFLRLLGDKVFTMGCSKFDDWERDSIKEASKRIFFKPYQGAIGSGVRSKDFFRFHGIPKDKVATEYNTVSIDRLLELSNTLPAPEGKPFSDRNFIIVARLVSKKNLHMAIDAYSQYVLMDKHPRELYICGSGILEDELKDKVKKLKLENKIIFTGFIQTQEISQKLGESLALILPSKEEQFGNVVIEAQALGLPVLLSDVCGARDKLVRTAVNGFVYEQDNPFGLAWFMSLLSQDQTLWEKMCEEAKKSARKGDVQAFADGVAYLLKS